MILDKVWNWWLTGSRWQEVKYLWGLDTLGRESRSVSEDKKCRGVITLDIISFISKPYSNTCCVPGTTLAAWAVTARTQPPSPTCWPVTDSLLPLVFSVPCFREVVANREPAGAPASGLVWCWPTCCSVTVIFCFFVHPAGFTHLPYLLGSCRRLSFVPVISLSTRLDLACCEDKPCLPACSFFERSGYHRPGLHLSFCLSGCWNKTDISYFYSRWDLKSNDLVCLKEKNQRALWGGGEPSH